MKILRTAGGFSLVESSQSENKTLKYYIDNGEDVSEYFDEYEKERLMSIEDIQLFVNECVFYS